MAQLVGTQVSSTLKIRARGSGWLGPVSPPDPPSEEGVLFVGGSNASNANPGTSAAPFATIQAAASVASPGTEIRIRDGVYRETVIPANSATQMTPIVFTADTRPDGTLAEPIISGANLIPDEAWTLTTAGVDNVLGPQGNVYHADITLPRTSVAPPSDSDFVNSNTALAGNQIFINGRAANITSWPKKVNHESQNDTRNWFDASRRVQEGSTTTNVPTAPWVMRMNLTTNRVRVQDPSVPTIDWTGAWVFDAFTYANDNDPVVGWGTNYFEWFKPTSSPGSIFMRGSTGLANSRAHFIQVCGAKALLTVGDSRNEWYYQPGRLFIRPPVDGGPPTGVEYKARNLGFDCTGKSYIHIKNLNFFACEWTESGFIARPESLPGVPAVTPTEGNLIEGCRFRYLHHWDMRPKRVSTPQENSMEEAQWPLFMLRPTMKGYPDQHGLRLTGRNTTVRDSVISQCAGNGLLVSGEDVRIENNYIEETGYKSGWAASVWCGVPNRATITRNTMRRTYRSHIGHFGKNKEISYNDFSEYMTLSNDGGCFYGAGRYEGFQLNSGETGSRDNLYSYYIQGRPPIITGTATAGGANSITLAAGTTGAFVGGWVELTSGAGSGQNGVIAAYDPTTRVAAVSPGRSTGGAITFQPGTGTGYRITRGLGTLAGAYDGTVIHHNWIHDSLCRPRGEPLFPPGSGNQESGAPNHQDYLQTVGHALYCDGDSDGLIFHHNVCWNNVWSDTNGNPEGVASVGPYFDARDDTVIQENPGIVDPRYAAGRFNRYYNNTFATEPRIQVGSGNSSYLDGGAMSSNMTGEQAAHPETYDNNIYTNNYAAGGVNAQGLASSSPKPTALKSTELGLRPSPNGSFGGTTSTTAVWDNPGSRGSRPAGGLGFQLASTSPARGRGVTINGRLDNNGNVIDFVDDATLAPSGSVDCGAYQFGVAPWVAGCDLPQEFIEGRPWEDQWA